MSAEEVAGKSLRELGKLVATKDARIAALEGVIREYVEELDNPAKDFAYRARLRRKMRDIVGMA